MKNHKLKSVFATVGLALTFAASAQDSVADNMLLFQRNNGGWQKHFEGKAVNYNKQWSPAENATIKEDKFNADATIDNGATTKEIRYLAKAYQKTGNKDYLKAAENGIRYLLKMQYASGGFPQYYPDTSLYRSEVTYNDNAMINALNVLWDVAHGTNGLDVVDASLVKPAEKAVEKGIQCILNTQVKVNGKLTVWCAQYDRRTLQPAKARAFELVSLSGSESVDIVTFLMKVENPSPAIQNAIKSAVEWFEKSRIDGYRYTNVKDASQPDGFDRVIVPDAGSVIWARFYDIDTNKPFFSGRDGVKKWNVSEIEYERRTGYGWYGTWPKELLEKDYPAWKKKNNL